MIFPRYKTKIENTTRGDIGPVAANMRQADIDEVWASSMLHPFEALTLGFEMSTLCKTISRNGTPIAIYGALAAKERPEAACVWMLGTNELYRMRTCFGTASREVLASLHATYPILYNYVDARNKKAIAWLKSCGATFADPIPYGVAKLPFMLFQLRKA